MIDRTFSKEDLRSIDRKKLERLVVDIYDALSDFVDSNTDWWELDETEQAERTNNIKIWREQLTK